MRRFLKRLLLLSVLARSSLASYCGKTAVPYSFEVLPNGAPVLGCAQPSCVAAAEEPLVEDSEFLTDVTGQSDGFFRDGDRSLKRYRHDSAPKLVANCSGQFNELSCPRKNQFVGGIEYIDHPRQPLILQCCTYDGLRFSQEVGTTTVGPGEAITGGEVVRGGRQISFDVIANVRKIVRSSSSQRVSYEVTVRRMNCLPDPPEPEVPFDQAVPSEVLKVLSSAKDVGSPEKQEKKVSQKEVKKDRKQYASMTQEISENAVQAAASRNNEVSLGPNSFDQASPLSQQNQQPDQQPVYQPQQAIYQPQQQFIDPNQQQQQTTPAALPETSTAFPTLPTLFPTHSFPTLPPHTFPTLPPHTFPTLPPHTFSSFTFPPLTVTPAPASVSGLGAAAPGAFPAPAFGAVPAASSGSIAAFAAPSVSAGSPSGGDLLPTLSPFTPPTFAPFSPLPVFGASTPAPFVHQPAVGQQQDGSATQFAQQNIEQSQHVQTDPQSQYQQQQFVQQPQQQVQQQVQQPAQQQIYSAASQPQSPTAAMGTILQNFHGNFRPIEFPGLGVVGYESAN